jgi:hypothetical protein
VDEGGELVLAAKRAVANSKGKYEGVFATVEETNDVAVTITFHHPGYKKDKKGPKTLP